MAYRISAQGVIDKGLSIIEVELACYDTLEDDDFQWDRDHLLHNRSAYELVRDQLSDAQRAELDKVDAHWQANPQAFNRAFGVEHHQHRRDTALAGFVEDDAGDVPPIPRGHWWWRPIERPAGDTATSGGG